MIINGYAQIKKAKVITKEWISHFHNFDVYIIIQWENLEKKHFLISYKKSQEIVKKNENVIPHLTLSYILIFSPHS